MSAVQPAYEVNRGLGFGCALGFLFSYVLYHCQLLSLCLNEFESVLGFALCANCGLDMERYTSLCRRNMAHELLAQVIADGLLFNIFDLVMH